MTIKIQNKKINKRLSLKNDIIFKILCNDTGYLC